VGLVVLVVHSVPVHIVGTAQSGERAEEEALKGENNMFRQMGGNDSIVERVQSCPGLPGPPGCPSFPGCPGGPGGPGGPGCDTPHPQQPPPPPLLPPPDGTTVEWDPPETGADGPSPLAPP
jgi:hypothetical protein